MRLPRLNQRSSVRSYLNAFERRFVRTADGVVYVPSDGGAGFALPADEAARLIAGMRATLFDADERGLFPDEWLVPMIIATPMLLTIFGVITGFGVASAALLIPIVIGMLALGPGMGLIRLELAWHRGNAAVNAAVQRFQRLPADAVRTRVPPNHARTVFFVALVLCGAVIFGLFLASSTSPEYARLQIDRLLAMLLGPMALVMITLGLLAAIGEATHRRRISEAEISEAMAARRRQPFP